MNRRQFAVALGPAALLAGCRPEQKPARDATLLHNENVREAVADVEQATNTLEMRIEQFNAENWQDALSNTQTAMIRMRTAVDELRRALGYEEPG